MSVNATIKNMKQVQGYKYNATSLRDSVVTPKTVSEPLNCKASVEETQVLSGRNGAFKTSKKSFSSFIG